MKKTILVGPICVAALVLAWAWALAGPVEEAVRVKDNGNNLRAHGGPGYQQAAVLDTMNKGECLRVWNRSPGWAEVGLPDGRFGHIHENCLEPADASAEPRPLDPALREKLSRFLTQLDRAARTGNFKAVELLLHPRGVVVNGRLYADAAKDPAVQKPVAAPLWYATDVSLTWGTPWDLLVAGTRPEPMEMGWDEATDTFVRLEPGDIGKPGKISAGPAYPEQGLLPMHARALRLSPEAMFVSGWPVEVVGYPLGEAWREDFQSVPFALVYQTGPGQYRLEQADHFGFMLYVEEYQGTLRLRGLATLAW